MPSSDYINAPISHWTVQEMPAFLQSVSGFSSTTPVEGTAHQDDRGNPVRPKWWSRATNFGDITMQRLLDEDGAWMDWRQEVIDGNKEAKRDITILAMTAEGDTVKTISCVGAWPSSHTLSGMDSAQDTQAFETLTLSIDSMTVENG